MLQLEASVRAERLSQVLERQMETILTRDQLVRLVERIQRAEGTNEEESVASGSSPLRLV